jgi:hypothetical protein
MLIAVTVVAIGTVGVHWWILSNTNYHIYATLIAEDVTNLDFMDNCPASENPDLIGV